MATVWFAARIALSYRATGRLRPVGSHHLPHLIMSGTMVYMLATVARPAQLSGAGAAAAAAPAVHFPLLALILAQFMAGYVMWTADRLPTLARVRAWRPAPAALVPATPDPVAALASYPGGGPASTLPRPAQPGRRQPGRAQPAALPPPGLVLQHRDGPGHGLHADHQPVTAAARYRSSAASRAVLCSAIGAG